jgi:putative ABC transport system ATP-binding protein
MSINGIVNKKFTPILCITTLDYGFYVLYLFSNGFNRREVFQMSSFVTFENVSKTYHSGSVEVEALKNVSFEIDKGEICVIVGQSGAGKTTLLNILGGMDTLTSGSVYLDGRNISAFNARQLAEYRRTDVGFIFQFYNLVPNLTALENVEIATMLVKDSLSPEETLINVGLKDRMKNFPAQLSGGEQQRVAIARALVKNPRLLLCDEPTGALDYGTGKQILKLLQEQSRKNGMTVIIITHNSALTAMADRVIRVKSGTIASIYKNETITPVEELEW